MLHLAKLCVGCTDIADLRAWQQRRAREDPPLRHRTRQTPRRAAEILNGGSLYWVIQGAMCVRQPILDVIAERMEDGSACCGLVLDPLLVPVAARPTRAFQGWRYLAADAAPADVTHARRAAGEDDLPPTMQRRLRELCLL
jgi:hypothetical protein